MILFMYFNRLLLLLSILSIIFQEKNFKCLKFVSSAVTDIANNSLKITTGVLSSQGKYLPHEIANFQLKDLLMNDCIGQAILSTYEAKRNLEPKYQIYLVQIIINHLLNSRHQYGQLTNDCFEVLAIKIKEIFPEEDVETYYIPPVRKRNSIHQKSGIARGKLPDKYKNLRTLLKEAGVIERKRSVYNPTEDKSRYNFRTSISSNIIDEESVRVSIEYLQSNTHPLETVLNHWVSTFQFRQKQISLEKVLPLSQIFNEWPILKNSFGYLLIEKDFELMYPNKINLMNKLGWLYETAAKCRSNSMSSEDVILFDLLKSDNLNEDSKNVIRLMLLASILPTKSMKIKKWKPTIAESRRGIIVTVNVLDEIPAKIQSKRIQMKSLDLPMQPFIIIESPTITEIKSIYVVIEDVQYEVPSVLKGLEVCFKTFIVINAPYPPEAEHLWTLIQWGIFEITRECDVKHPFVVDFLKKIKKV